MTLFGLFLWPLLAVILLPGLLVYLGLHVVERGVIFVDLALAQIAAFGVCVAIVIGSSTGGQPQTYAISLTFSLAGAALFAWTRFRHPRISQEAIIGIFYVVAAAASTLVLSRTAEGAEVIEGLLLGNILLVTREHVLSTFALYAVIATVHWNWRKRFLQCSFDENGAIREGISLRKWDFFFYATFGIVVMSFVQLAGVYLVFSYLIVPSVCGALLATRIRSRLIIGWIAALIAGVTGLVLSVELEGLDLPTGPTIVCLFGLLLVTSGALCALGTFSKSPNWGQECVSSLTHSCPQFGLLENVPVRGQDSAGIAALRWNVW